MSKNRKIDLQTDFSLFDNIIDNVELQRREEEEFFEDKKKEESDSNFDTMEINVREDCSHSSLSVQVDNGPCLTPNYLINENFMADSRCNSTDSSIEKLESNTDVLNESYVFEESLSSRTETSKKNDENLINQYTNIPKIEYNNALKTDSSDIATTERSAEEFETKRDESTISYRKDEVENTNSFETVADSEVKVYGKIKSPIDTDIDEKDDSQSDTLTKNNIELFLPQEEDSSHRSDEDKARDNVELFLPLEEDSNHRSDEGKDRDDVELFLPQQKDSSHRPNEDKYRDNVELFLPQQEDSSKRSDEDKDRDDVELFLPHEEDSNYRSHEDKDRDNVEFFLPHEEDSSHRFDEDKDASFHDNPNDESEKVLIANKEEEEEESKQDDSKVFNDENKLGGENHFSNEEINKREKVNTNNILLKEDSFEDIQVSIHEKYEFESKHINEVSQEDSRQEASNDEDITNFLEEILNNLPAEKFNEEEGMEEKENSFLTNGKGEENTEKIEKKKKVIFEREKDTFDEAGDRRFDISALEMVSEDECEYVNLQEVQQARKELEEYTKDFDNFNNVIAELEKQPESKKNVEIELEDLLSEHESTKEEDQKSPNESSQKKKTKKKKGKKVFFNKICVNCNNPITIKQYAYPKLDEIFSDDIQCESCFGKNCGSTTKKRIVKKKQENKPTNKDDSMKKEIKPALDSRLESSQNETLKKWLKEKDKAEKKRKSQERKERKKKTKEEKLQRLKEKEKLIRAQQKLEEWEERKRKEAREKKKSGISASLKTNFLKPISHSQSKASRHSASDVSSPRSDATFDVNEENSFENFRKTYLQRDYNPYVFTSVEGFVQHIINESVSELQSARKMKEIRLQRPKSHAIHLLPNKEKMQHRPAPPKSANPRKNKHENGIYRRQTHSKENKNTLISHQKLLRSKTYEEWLMDKRLQHDVKAREQEINKHYDKLQTKLIELEKERRNTLLELRQNSVHSFQQTKLPGIAKRLEPQGSESKAQNFEMS